MKVSRERSYKIIRPEDDAMLFAVGQIRAQVERLSAQIKSIR